MSESIYEVDYNDPSWAVVVAVYIGYVCLSVMGLPECDGFNKCPSPPSDPALSRDFVIFLGLALLGGWPADGHVSDILTSVEPEGSDQIDSEVASCHISTMQLNVRSEF